MNRLIIILFFLITPLFSFSQFYHIEGFVKSKDGNILIGATVYDTISNSGTITNEQGYYRIQLKKGKHVIRFSYIGYSTSTFSIQLTKNIKKNIVLVHSTLNEIVIKGRQQTIHLNSIQKPMEMDMITIKSIPSIIGEPDIMKAISILPGISQTSEASSNLSVRGANHDQNLIILDQAPLYQTGHLFGFISPFNYMAIKDVKVYKNAIPSIYGGKLSSVIELHSKNGNNDSLKYSYNFGLLNAGFSLSTPIIKDKISLFISGRTFYLGLLTLPLYYLYKTGQLEGYGTYYLYDINTNIKFTPNEKEEISLYIYSGIDKLGGANYSDNSLKKISKSNLSWGNHTLSFKYKRRLNKNMFFKNHLTFSKSFNCSYNSFTDELKTDENFEKTRISSLNNFSFKSYFETYKGIHYFRYGFESNLNNITPFEEKRTGKVNNYINNHYFFYQMDLYADDLIEFGILSFYFGLRLSNYFTKNKNYWNLEPRISAQYKINKSKSTGIGYQRLAQYSFLMPITNLGLPNDIWVSVLDDMSPSIIDQFFFEYNMNFYNELFNIETNLFYRKYSSLFDLKNKTSFVFAIPLDWQNYLSKNGIAYAYGLELQTKINFNKLIGIISYTYSRNKYKFIDLNKGKWFPGYYDFPHQLDINFSGKLYKKWNYSVLFTYKSGRPVTLPFEILEKSSVGSVIIYGDKNNGRLSPYHRLDLSVSKTWITKKTRIKTLTFSLFNAYYHKNPFYYEYIREEKVFNETTNKYEYKKVQPRIEEFSLIPIVPSVSYTIQF